MFDFKNNTKIINIIKEKNINYIIPLSNKDYDLIKNVELDNITVDILYPNKEIFELLNNKLSFTKFMLENFSDMIPKVYYLENFMLSDIEFPVISKLIYSTNGFNMKIYSNSNEFNKCKKKIIVQKLIEHEYEYSAYILCDKGKIINSKIIRYKYPKFSIKNRNFPKNFETVYDFDNGLFEKIISKLNYSGGMCIDFKFDESTNNIYIFEINPQFGGSAFTNDFIYELLCIE